MCTYLQCSYKQAHLSEEAIDSHTLYVYKPYISSMHVLGNHYAQASTAITMVTMTSLLLGRTKYLLPSNEIFADECAYMLSHTCMHNKRTHANTVELTKHTNRTSLYVVVPFSRTFSQTR